jgi:hypothetical protein
VGEAGEPAAGVGHVMAAGCGLLVAGSLAGAVIASAPSAREATLQPDRDSHERHESTKCHGSRVAGRGSRVEGRGSRVEGRGSRVEGRGSRVAGHESWVMVMRAVTRLFVIPAQAGIHEGSPAALHQPGGLGITKADKSPLPYPEAAPDFGKTQTLAYFSDAHDRVAGWVCGSGIRAAPRASATARACRAGRRCARRND